MPKAEVDTTTRVGAWEQTALCLQGKAGRGLKAREPKAATLTKALRQAEREQGLSPVVGRQPSDEQLALDLGVPRRSSDRAAHRR